MDATLSELLRLLENLIRLGTVAEVDGDRVRIQSGKTVSGWLPWIVARAGTTRTWEQLTVGEQGIIFSPGGETTAAVFLAGLYSDYATPPSTNSSVHTRHYPDGAKITYNHATHALSAVLPAGGTAVVDAPVSVTVISELVHLNAPETHCTGNLTVDKRLTYKGGMTGSNTAGGSAASINGGIAFQDGDLTHNGVNIGSTHKHPNVQPGSGTSGGPQ